MKSAFFEVGLVALVAATAAAVNGVEYDVASCAELQDIDRSTVTSITITSSPIVCDSYTRFRVRNDLVIKSDSPVVFSNFALRVQGNLIVEPDVTFKDVTEQVSQKFELIDPFAVRTTLGLSTSAAQVWLSSGRLPRTQLIMFPHKHVPHRSRYTPNSVNWRKVKSRRTGLSEINLSTECRTFFTRVRIYMQASDSEFCCGAQPPFFALAITAAREMSEQALCLFRPKLKTFPPYYLSQVLETGVVHRANNGCIFCINFCDGVQFDSMKMCSLPSFAH